MCLMTREENQITEKSYVINKLTSCTHVCALCICLQARLNGIFKYFIGLETGLTT